MNIWMRMADIWKRLIHGMEVPVVLTHCMKLRLVTIAVINRGS